MAAILPADSTTRPQSLGSIVDADYWRVGCDEREYQANQDADPGWDEDEQLSPDEHDRNWDDV